jgi:branched-chain amino acid transport system permease protein
VHIPFPPFTPELAILFGTLSASLLGLVVGSIAIRRQGIYFAMTTLAFAQMIFFLAVQIPFTHGEDGIQAVPRGKLFGLISLESQITMYFVVLAIFAFAMLALYRIIHSPFGEVLKSIRENEARAISLGYKTDRYNLVAFVLSTTICGLGGATKAIVFQLASLTDVSSGTSGEAVLMTLVGGLGTVLGPIIGATIITAMDTYLADTSWLIGLFQSFLPSWLTSALAGFLNVTVLEGIVFVICVMAFRRGLLGEIAHRIGRPL